MTTTDRGEAALNRRSFDEAEALLRRAMGLKDDSAEVHYLLGVLHEMRDERDAAYRVYRAALKPTRARAGQVESPVVRQRFGPGHGDANY